MVDTKYRWDFIGLSTDEKPLPSNSDKVVDGSTFYCSDTSKLYVFCKDTWYEKTATGGGGTSYTAGSGIDITNNTISVDTQTIQPKLTAGSNVTISDNTISATDTTYTDFVGTDGQTAGTAGLVPAPATTDADKFLKSDGTWATAGGSSINVVQTTGSSTTDVMSQDATTKMVFDVQNNQKRGIRIGNTNNVELHGISIGENSSTGTAYTGIAIGRNALATGRESIAIGSFATASGVYSIALGQGSQAQLQGLIDVGINDGTSRGFNNSTLRLLRGLYDGQLSQDAVTVSQINSVIDAINTALSVSIPHIGASN